MAELVYGRIGIWTKWFMAESSRKLETDRKFLRNPNLNEIVVNHTGSLMITCWSCVRSCIRALLTVGSHQRQYNRY